MSISRVILSGNLGRDPELREVGDSSVCSFSIPLTTRRRGESATTWFAVSAWGKLGEVCHEHLSKGSAVVVDGNLQVREYEKDGETKQVLEIRASDVQFGGLSPASRSAAQTSESTKPSSDGDSDSDDNDDAETGLPF